MTANFQIRVFGHGTENFKKYSFRDYSFKRKNGVIEVKNHSVTFSTNSLEHQCKVQLHNTM